MKKLLALLTFIAFASADCSALMKKYNAPDPTIKTMKQIKRWAKRKLKKAPQDEKEELLKCMLSQAADNPNKATVAGE